MVQMEKGKKGQADLTAAVCGPPDDPINPSFYGTGTLACHPTYLFLDVDYIFVVCNSFDLIAYEDSNNSSLNNGWNVTSTGIITVPDDAEPNVYTAGYMSHGGCVENGVTGALIQEFAFEVVSEGVVLPGPGDPICRL